ncbi:MAG: glycosyltransferase family 2 protein [Candidatus Dormibacteria bacterium]
MPAPSSSAPLASVVILNYNGIAVLPACLEAVRRQQLDGEFEVIVVDNASADGSAARVREAYPWVRLEEAGGNLGFAGGNNLGISRANGEFVVLLNNDTAVRPGWLAALLAAARADPRAGAVTSKLVFMHRPGVIQNAGCLLLSDGSGGDRGSQQPDTGQFDRGEEVFAFCGAAVLLRREALEDVGAFDDDFFMYYEDLDLSWRMRLRGWKVLYAPGAVVDHAHAGTSVEGSPFFIFHADRNRLFMVLKNAPPAFVLRSFAGFYGRALGNLLGRRRGGHANPAGDVAPPLQPGSSRARIHFRVAASFLRLLPAMLRRRAEIRRRRTAPDTEVMRWLYPRAQWDAR